MDLELAPGEIHALLGENGAGKSTLMNVLVGLLRADAGGIEIRGRRVDPARYGPARAGAAGVAMVHQHSALVPAMTVEENVAFGDPAGGFWFRRKRARRAIAELAERFDLEVSPEARVADLSVGQRQRAEILRALARGLHLLVLDEPTAALTPGEARALYPALRRLRDAGRSVVFISHKLEEIEDLGDRITVLRRGRVVGSLARDEADAAALGRMMLGRDLPPLDRGPVVRSAGAPALALRGLSAEGIREASRLERLDLEVFGGEIVGVAGIDGNGQRELEELLAGVRPATAGHVELRGQRVAPRAPALRSRGVAQLSGDRERTSLVSHMTVAENLVLKSTADPRFFPHGWLDRAACRRFARAAVERYGIDPPEPEAPLATLSGGNAQKVAVARELSGAPAVLIAVNPTRGLDVGSTRFVHEQLLARRAAGGAVLLISTELDEVLALSDRMVALVRGRILSVPPGSSRAELGALLLGRRVA